MEDFLLPMALFFVVVTVIGLSIWLTFAFIRRNKGENPAAEGAGGQEVRLFTAPAPSAAPGKDVLQVRLNAQGLWEVWIYGTRYTNLDAVPDVAVRDQVVDAVRILAGFSRSYIQKQQKPAAPTVEAQAPKPLIPESGSVPKVTLPPASGVELRRPTAPPTLIPEINLAKEIGDIVDELKARSPSLRERSVRLQNALGGGVAFVVDGMAYDSVADIPDIEVQALIRAATKEWERR